MDPALHITSPPRRTFEGVAVHLALHGLTALLLAVAFPEPGWWPLAWVALVPMGVLVARSGKTWRLLWTGAIVFLAWWLVRMTWMIPVTFGGYLGICVVMMVYWTLALLTLRVLHARTPVPMAVLLPMVWVSVEFLRATFPLGGFGWFALSHSQASYVPEQGAGRIVQVADLFGEWTVSFLVAMTNGLIVDAFTRPWWRTTTQGGVQRRFGRMRPGMRGVLAGWAAAITAAWFYGQMRVAETDGAVAPGIAVAVVQSNVAQSNKVQRTPEQEEAWWREMVALTRTTATLDPTPALIVWPETMVPAAINPEAVAAYLGEARFWRSVDPAQLRLSPDAALYEEVAASYGVTLDELPAARAQQFQRRASIGGELAALARDLGVPMIVGASADHIEDDRFNSAFLVRPDGTLAPGRYDKIGIVPFGEYIPWISGSPFLRDLFLRYLSPYPYDYSLTPGSATTLFTVPAAVPGREGVTPVSVGTPICFEDAIPAICREMVYGGDDGKQAQLLVNLTNDGWFAGTDQPLQHLQLATLRSIENRVPTARSVNTGVSGFIDSAGRVGPVIGLDVADVEAHRVAFDPRHTLFGVVGRGPVTLLALATATMTLAAAFWPRRPAVTRA